MTTIQKQSKTKRRLTNEHITAITLSLAIVASITGVSAVQASVDPIESVDPQTISGSYGSLLTTASGKILTISGNTFSGEFVITATTITGEHCPEGAVIPNPYPGNTLTGTGSGLNQDFLFGETSEADPGVYHCTVVFTASGLDITNSPLTGSITQDVWLSKVGSKGFWKNHPEAVAQHITTQTGINIGGTEFTGLDDVIQILDMDPLVPEPKGKAKDNGGKDNLQKQHQIVDQLAAQFVAAYLNIWAVEENDTDCVGSDMETAWNTLSGLGWTGVNTAVPQPPEYSKGDINDIKDELEDFNTGGCSGSGLN
jgi:hypothetical protein